MMFSETRKHVGSLENAELKPRAGSSPPSKPIFIRAGEVAS